MSFVRTDVKDGWCFSCIASFLTVSLINGMRGQKKKIIKTANFIDYFSIKPNTDC